MTDEEFLRTFEAGQWPLEQWHHKQHIKVAYLYLRQLPLDQAIARIRQGIKAHNAAQGVKESPTSGYHETMTQAWLRLVDVTLKEYGAAENADAFYERNPQLWQTKTLRLFYSKELFMSPRAKGEFVQPDMASLPVSGNTRG
jgi:hypothetical protein